MNQKDLKYFNTKIYTVYIFLYILYILYIYLYLHVARSILDSSI